MTAELQQRRLAAVREHMESENSLDFDRTIATFAWPRYELMATGDVFDGEAEVRSYYARTRGDFPDQRNENSVLRRTCFLSASSIRVSGSAPLRDIPDIDRER